MILPGAQFLLLQQLILQPQSLLKLLLLDHRCLLLNGKLGILFALQEYEQEHRKKHKCGQKCLYKTLCDDPL